MLAFALAVLLSAPVSAQVDTGSISGTVKDETGGVLPGATVTITHEGQAFTLSTVTRQDGTYIFTPIRTGAYVIDSELAGFRKGVRRGITVGIQEQVRVDFTLQAGAVAEEVLVTGESPLLQTSSGTVGETLKSGAIEDLPINGRDYTSLARLVAGVVPPQPGARAPLMFSANGVRPAQNNYLLDGIDNNTSNVDFLSGVAYIVKPPVDAVDEIKVLTSSFSAEYGRAGGAVLNTTLKSGTNQLRGTVWEFYRNDALNANDYFANRAGIKKGDYLSNQYGFTVGGPVMASKTFWFADYEGSLIKQARTWVRTVPTALQRSSGFTNFADLITPAKRNGRCGRPWAYLSAWHRLRPRDHASVAARTGGSGHRARRGTRRLRARCVPRQPDPGEPAQRRGAEADAALSGAEPAGVEQQLRGEPDQHGRHARVRRPGRSQLQRQRSRLRALQLLGQPQAAPVAVRGRWRRRGLRGRRRDRWVSTDSRPATRTCCRRR